MCRSKNFGSAKLGDKLYSSKLIIDFVETFGLLNTTSA